MLHERAESFLEPSLLVLVGILISLFAPDPALFFWIFIRF